MRVVIPMAGTGDRFVRKGYKDPKPLIKVKDKEIVKYVFDQFPKDIKILAICNNIHENDFNISSRLFSLRDNIEIAFCEQHKKGPVYTILPYLDSLDDDEEVIICYCDNPFIWNYNEFTNYVYSSDLDGCILTHSGFHPHSINTTKMAFLKTKGNLVEEIKEKECYTDNHLNEHASTGLYYFRRGSDVKKYFKELVEKDISYNGEYYVTLVYNLLINDGLKVGFYDTEFVTVFGTPEEVESFEAWNTIISSGQVKSEEDLKNVYTYWKAYANLTSR